MRIPCHSSRDTRHGAVTNPWRGRERWFDSNPGAGGGAACDRPVTEVSGCRRGVDGVWGGRSSRLAAVKVVSVVGNRPQFIKAAPLARALAPLCDHVLVHTGQHYDEELSAVFFDELGLQPPDHRIETGSGSHAQQTGSMLVGLEPVLASEQPDVVLVYGDTNSTLAGALVAVKSGYRLGHVKSGLRSFDRAMPEEVNRVVTDVISDLRFCPSPAAFDTLKAEGITQGVHLGRQVVEGHLAGAEAKVADDDASAVEHR